MNRDLQQEYADLTRQLAEITRRRNELGELIAKQQSDAKLAAARVGEKRIIKAILAVVKDGDWAKQTAALDVTDWRLNQLFTNQMLKIRRAMPEHAEALPARIGPQTLARSKEWVPIVRKYLTTI